MKRSGTAFSAVKTSNAGAARLLYKTMDQKPVAFIGAGVSARYGFPAWNEMLKRLHRMVDRSGIWDPAKSEAVANLDDALWQAQEYKEAIGPRFNAKVGRLFAKANKRSNLVKKLVGLRFSHFVTTNYDKVLEREMRRQFGRKLVVIHWDRPEEARRFVRNFNSNDGRRFLVYLHGRHDRPESIVLTEEDYASRYLKTDETKRKLFALFAAKPVVFIGFSLRDPDLVTTLREVNAHLAFSEGPSRHFALLSLSRSDPQESSLRAYYVRRYGVQPVFYPYSVTHHQLDRLIGCLSTGKFAGMPRIEPPARDPEDPQKNQWGQQSTKDGYTLSATVHPIDDDWYRVRLRVQAGTDADDLQQPVLFHLHDTFAPMVRDADDFDQRCATLEVEAYGAFTVGAQLCGNKWIRLELDLSDLEKAPKAFLEG